MLLPALQVLGPRFDVLLTSYETVLKDKSELKKLSYAVRSRPSGRDNGCGGDMCMSTQHPGSWMACGVRCCSGLLKPNCVANSNVRLSPIWHRNDVALLNVPGMLPCDYAHPVLLRRR
jgi:hypothetical protein